MHSEGFFGRAGKRKLLVSKANWKKRLGWCRERRDWDSEWNSVIWNDESRFLLFQNDAHHWVWHKPHEKYDVNCLILTVKGSQGVMLWGYFAKDKLGPLIQVSGSITGAVYINILENNLLSFYNSLGGNLSYIFQDNNAPVHRARTVRQWKEDNSILSLPWPALLIQSNIFGMF